MSGDALRSGQVADAAGVNVQTLRYYERRGLLAEPDRSPGGHRLYGEEAVTVLRVIKAAQRLGFTLDEVAELLDAGRHRHGRPVPGLQDRAAAKLAEVDAKIADLTTIRAALVTAVDAGCDDLTECATSPRCLLPFADLAEKERRAGPAADPASHRAPKALASLAGLACLACCLLPVLITAGVVGAGASAVVGWLPAVALALAALAGATWWFGRRRTACGCGASGQGGCGSKAPADPLPVTNTGRK